MPQKCTSGCTYTDDEASDAGEIDLAEALTESDDYYFYNLGDLFYYSPNPDGIQKMAAEYGLGETTGIDLPGEDTGQVDSAALRAKPAQGGPDGLPLPELLRRRQHRDRLRSRRDVGHPDSAGRRLCHLRQRRNPVPAQVAAAIVSPTGKLVKQFQPKVTGTVSLPPSTYQPMLEGFEGVVSNKSGTAYLPFQEDAHFPLNSYPIAGKTGTADVAAGKEPNAWFVGFGPTNHAAEQPEYVVAVVVDHGGYGAQAAAPAVGQHLQLPLRQPDPAGAAPHRRRPALDHPSVHRSAGRHTDATTTTTSTTAST